MRKLIVIVGIDKSNLIKSNKRIVACGKNFENVSKSSQAVNIAVVIPRVIKDSLTAGL